MKTTRTFRKTAVLAVRQLKDRTSLAPFGSESSSSRDDFSQIDTYSLSNSQQCIQRRIAQVPLDQADNGVRKTGTLGQHIHGKPVSFTFFPQELDNVSDDSVSQTVFWHIIFISKIAIDNVCDYGHNGLGKEMKLDVIVKASHETMLFQPQNRMVSEWLHRRCGLVADKITRNTGLRDHPRKCQSIIAELLAAGFTVTNGQEKN